jgi:hypothetical protein
VQGRLSVEALAPVGKVANWPYHLTALPHPDKLIQADFAAVGANPQMPIQAIESHER